MANEKQVAALNAADALRRYYRSKKDDVECFTKARAAGEQTFTLRSQDVTSPRVIAYWILENIETAPPEKLMDALMDAIEMREHPSRRNAD